MRQLLAQVVELLVAAAVFVGARVAAAWRRFGGRCPDCGSITILRWGGPPTQPRAVEVCGEGCGWRAP
jgi:hypothetical protein